MRHAVSALGTLLLLAAAPAALLAGTGGGWELSFRAGMADPATGRPIGGTEIIHLVPHKGRLFAANGYWMDPRKPEIPWAQVLVLDSPRGRWRVDLAMGPTHLRATALASVTFRTDGAGRPLPSPVTLLLAGADARDGSHLWTRDDEAGTWTRTPLPSDPRLRRSTRAFIVHRDRRTGVDRLFVATGAPGVFSGVYDPARPGKVRWDERPELGPVRIRPMAFAEAGGRLYVSVGPTIWARVDGPSPRWEKVYEDETPEHWALGGIRGLTAVPAPQGRGESVLFSHTDRLIRLDPFRGHQATVELRIRPLLQRAWGTAVSGPVIAAYNRLLPLRDPATGRTVHLAGLEARIERGGREKTYRPDTFYGWYAGGAYLVREGPGRYRLGEVNGRWAPGKPKLVAVRTYAVSPFPEDGGRVVYFGGFDANFFPARDTAWIWRARVETVLGR